MKVDFTASVYIFNEDFTKVLLLFHRKLQKWLPAGGHLESNETPPEAVIREAKEETNLDIELVKQENVWINRWNAKSIERPFLSLIEQVPAHGDEPAHQHIDFVYVAMAKGTNHRLNERESLFIRWFDLKELAELKPDQEVYVESLQVMQAIVLAFTPQAVALA